MPGTHYTLDREKKAAADAAIPTEKACRDCKIVKPNTAKYFGTKLNGSMHEFTTVDVCHVCKGRKVSEGHKRRRDELEAARLANDMALFRQALELKRKRDAGEI